MKNFAILMLSGALLSGCMSTSMGGAGNTSGGTPISGELVLDAAGVNGNFILRKPAGRTCTGNVTFDSGSAHDFPLTCDDGTTGQAIATINRFGSQMTISYRLDDGEEGSIVTGAT